MERACLRNEMCFEQGVSAGFAGAGTAAGRIRAIRPTNVAPLDEKVTIKANRGSDFVRYLLTPEDTSAGAVPNANIPAAWGRVKVAFWAVAGVLSLIALFG